MLSFDAISGQDRAVADLRRAYLSDHLPHGLIFAGPTGVGKSTTARALATLFLCDKPKDDHPCGKCPACHLMEAGNHPDFHTVYRQLIRLEKKDSKAKDLSIDVIRQYLVGPANLKPQMERGKVFVIEEAERMNAEAQNSMLKTLEEPAGRTLIILLIDQPNALLPTIRSRCQLIRFNPLPTEFVRTELEKRGKSKQDAQDAADFAEGSLGLALQWLEDGVVDRARDLRHRLTAITHGQIMADLPDWFRASGEAYAEKQLERDELASKDQATREGMSLYLRLAAQELRKQLAAADDPSELEPICSAIDATARADEYLEGNVNLALIFQQLAVTLERLFGRAGKVGTR